MKDTSGSGYIRTGSSPNVRVQDGIKRFWLCTGCEALLGRAESDFAAKLFLPYVNGKSTRIVYGEWLLQFCVSVSWRVLLLYKEETGFKSYDADAVQLIDKAEATWRAFLLGLLPHPASFEQHLYPFEVIERIGNGLPDMAPNINRYLTRAFDTDLGRGGSRDFIYAKLGRFAILGFIREDRRNEWHGGKVHVRNGVIEPGRYTMPGAFLYYLNSRARRMAELLAGISSRQAEKIDQALRDNAKEYVGSDEFLAMQRDVEMFGDAAFTPHLSSDDGQR